MTMQSKPPSAQARLEAITARRMRDPYANLLRDSREMKREHASARDAWFAALNLERKEDVLFELETLLKSVVAWANPRNHPRRAGTPRAADRDFHAHALVARAVVARALALTNQLLGAQLPLAPVARNLSHTFARAAAPERPPEGPVESLVALRGGLTTHLEILDGVAREGSVPFRLFYSTADALRREVARNAHFNPLYLLEFRPEFDRIRSPEILDAMQSVDGEAPHRAVALAFLGHLRLLRLSQLLLQTALDPTSTRRAYAVLAVVRAEQRALGGVLAESMGDLLADAMEREVLKLSATELKQRFEVFSREAERQRQLRAALTTSAAVLDAECRRALLIRVPPCEDASGQSDLNAQCAVVAQRLREALQDNMLQLATALRGAADAERAFGDRSARRSISERHRQQAWLFRVVVLAFVAKAKASTHEEGDRWVWTPASPFAAEFAQHFERIGLSLALRGEYPETERLQHAVAALRETDLPSRVELEAASAACESFADWLAEQVELVGRRDELRAIPLDRGAAGETLRAYLPLQP